MILLKDIMEDYIFLKRLFRYEFIYDDSKDDAEEIRELVSYFRERGMIFVEDREGDAWIVVRGIGPRT